MRFQGALIREQGIEFGVVIVQRRVIDNRSEADRVIAAFQDQVFPNIPVILMAQDSRGRPSYYGRTDIARFLANVPLESIPWREYTISG